MCALYGWNSYASKAGSLSCAVRLIALLLATCEAAF